MWEDFVRGQSVYERWEEFVRGGEEFVRGGKSL